MINPRLLASLTDSIQEWMDHNCEEDWWQDGAGYVSEGCSARLALACALTLEESKLAPDLRET